MRTAFAILLLCTTAHAQTVVDGSTLPSEDMKIVAEYLGRELNYPQSAQLRSLRKIDSGYCAEMNTRNRMGGYEGFSPLYINTKDRLVFHAQAKSVLELKVITPSVSERASDAAKRSCAR